MTFSRIESDDYLSCLLRDQQKKENMGFKAIGSVVTPGRGECLQVCGSLETFQEIENDE